MPELPDLVHVEARLREMFVGRKVIAARAGDPVVFRVMTPDPFPHVVAGATLASVERRGHFMRFGFTGLEDGVARVLVINAMLVGKYVIAPGRPERDPNSLLLAMAFAGPSPGEELQYWDDKRMGKVYWALAEQENTIPGYRDLGLDVLSPSFTLETFTRLVKRRRDQVRNFLLDKTALASIGNAYADEILFEAQLHPKTFCNKLDDAAIARLHAAISLVLRRAIDEIRARNPDVKEKVRDFLSVRGRQGQPCPRCGTKLRAVRVGAADASFCPTCQPATRALFIDWKGTAR